MKVQLNELIKYADGHVTVVETVESPPRIVEGAEVIESGCLVVKYCDNYYLAAFVPRRGFWPDRPE